MRAADRQPRISANTLKIKKTHENLSKVTAALQTGCERFYLQNFWKQTIKTEKKSFWESKPNKHFRDVSYFKNERKPEAENFKCVKGQSAFSKGGSI